MFHITYEQDYEVVVLYCVRSCYLFVHACLNQGEKLLNGLGGIFSKPWKAKKTKEINGPDMSAGLLLL